MGSNQELVERVKAAMKSGKMADLGRLLTESATDDYVQEWPQSGERIVGRDGVIKLNEGYSQMTGTEPKMTFRRLLTGGEIAVVEGTIDYGDGVPVSYVSIVELRDGKIAKSTDYFANPFEAPVWRADMVERMEPATVR